MVSLKQIKDAVKACLVRAGTTFRKDQLEAYQRAVRKEKNKNARWVLEKLLENARVAKKRSFPLCDDTGIPHLFIEIGREVSLPKDWLSAISRGVAEGLRTMPGRPMAVKGNPVERIQQSKGLFKDPAKLSIAPVVVKPIKGIGSR
jgi:fumarate hydratase subunit alpha